MNIVIRLIFSYAVITFETIPKILSMLVAEIFQVKDHLLLKLFSVARSESKSYSSNPVLSLSASFYIHISDTQIGGLIYEAGDNQDRN